MKTMRLKAVRSAIVAASSLLLAGLSAAEPVAIARYKDWQVFTNTVDGAKVCYAATEADDKAPRSVEHGDVWFYLTSWQSGLARNQPSLKVGYDLRAELPTRARIGRRTWSLFNVGAEAFADDADDPALVGAIKRGLELRVEAVSERGTAVAYHFSLSGSSDAITRAARACG